MHLFLIPFLAAVAGVIALPVLKMGPQAAVEGKLEVREPEVSSWFQVVFFSQKKGYKTDKWTFDEKVDCKSCLSLSYTGVGRFAN